MAGKLHIEDEPIPRLPPAIIIISAKHIVHGMVLLASTAADKVMNTSILFDVSGGRRWAVIGALMGSAALTVIPLVRRVTVGQAIAILAPQQALLILSCCGSALAIYAGHTPSGRDVAPLFLFQDQLTLFSIAALHFWSFVAYARKLS